MYLVKIHLLESIGLRWKVCCTCDAAENTHKEMLLAVQTDHAVTTAHLSFMLPTAARQCCGGAMPTSSCSYSGGQRVSAPTPMAWPACPPMAFATTATAKQHQASHDRTERVKQDAGWDGQIIHKSSYMSWRSIDSHSLIRARLDCHGEVVTCTQEPHCKKVGHVCCWFIQVGSVKTLSTKTLQRATFEQRTTKITQILWSQSCQVHS